MVARHGCAHAQPLDQQAAATRLQLGQLGKHGRIGQSGEEGAHSSRHPPQLKRWVCCQGLAGRAALFLHGWELGPNASDAINEACGRTGLARLTAPQHISRFSASHLHLLQPGHHLRKAALGKGARHLSAHDLCHMRFQRITASTR